MDADATPDAPAPSETKKAATPTGHKASVTPLDSARMVMASTDGSALRRIVRDVDSTKLAFDLASPGARNVRRLAVAKVADMLTGKGKAAAATADAVTDAADSCDVWSELPECEAARANRIRGLGRVTRLLIKSHSQRQVRAGWKGAAAVLVVAWLVVRIGAAAVLRSLARAVRDRAGGVFGPARRRGTGAEGAGLSAGVAWSLHGGSTGGGGGVGGRNSTGT